MNWKNYKATPLLLSICVTCAVLFLGQALWQNYAIAKPLGKALQDINGVTQAVWLQKSSGSDEMVFEISLSNVENLALTYKEITKNIQQTIKDSKFQINLHDQRTPELEQIYYALHVYLQEAIVTGNFSLMQQRIDETAKAKGASAKVYVETNAIYLSLSKEKADMYVVIPRQNYNGEGKKNAPY